MDTREWIDASTIPGNAPKELKQSLVDLISAQAKLSKARGTRGFEPEITSRVEWTDISILPKAEEPEKLEGRVVGEITVQEGVVVCHDKFVSFRSRALLLFLSGLSARHVEWERIDPRCLLCAAGRRVRLVHHPVSPLNVA